MGSFRWLSVSGYVHYGASFDGLHGPDGAVYSQDAVDDHTYGRKFPGRIGIGIGVGAGSQTK